MILLIGSETLVRFERQCRALEGAVGGRLLGLERALHGSLPTRVL